VSSEAIAPRTDGLTLLVADLVLGNAGIAAWLSVDAVRLFGFSGPAAETGTHKLLSGAASHACCLRVAVLHTLLLGGSWALAGVASAAAIATAKTYLFMDSLS